MRILKFAPLVLLAFAIKPMRKFFDRYKFGLYYLDKHDDGFDEDDVLINAMDLRGRPTHACICGGTVWNLQASFEDYEIATYYLEMQCTQCGSLATAPTPLDRETLE